MTEKLTEAQCEATQTRSKNAHGDKWPYKGYVGERSIGPLPEVPGGWEYIYIPTWGVHLRKSDDLDYRRDL